MGRPSRWWVLLWAALVPLAARAQPASQPASAPAAEGGAELIADPEDDGWTPPLPDRAAPVASPDAASVEPPTTLSARAQLRLALDTYLEGPHPSEPGGYHEDVMQLTGQAMVTVSHRARRWLRLKAGGRLLYRLTARQGSDPDESYYLFNGDVHRNDFEAELLDTYVALRAPSWLDIQAGTITAIWGVTDLTNPNDVLARRDLRDGMYLDPETSRLPSPMVRAEAFLPGRLALAAYFIPVFLPDRIDLFGSDFSLFGPLAPKTFHWLGELADGMLDDSVEGVAQQALSQTRLPRPFSDPSLAARVSWSARGWDLALQYAWLFERQPSLRLEKSLVLALLPLFASGRPTLTPDDLAAVAQRLAADPCPIELAYRRQQHAGLSISGAIWELSLNLDLAYRSRQAVPLGGAFPLESDPDDDRWLSNAVDSQVVAYTVGLTYVRGEEILATLEWWHQVYLDLALDDTERELLLGGTQLGGLAALVRYRLQRPVDLTFQLLVHSDLLSRSVIVTPQVTWRPNDHLGVVVGGNIFEGSERSLGGRLDRNDQVYLGVEGFL